MCLVCNIIEALINVDLIPELICLNYFSKRKQEAQDLEFKSCEKNINDDFSSLFYFL